MSELEYLIDKAKQAGAEQVEAMKLEGTSLSLSYRQGQVEHLERAEGSDVGLRVLVGKRQAVTSTGDFSKRSLDKLVERAMDMVKVVPEDPYVGLASSSQFMAKTRVAEGGVEPEVHANELQQRAKEAEEAALSVKGVKQSEGASATWGGSSLELMTSEGFAGSYKSTQQNLSCMVLAGSGDEMQRDYDYGSARRGADLPDPSDIGRNAGERAVKRLHPRKVKTGQHPIIYDRRLGWGYLLLPFIDAINGLSVARGTSFLRDGLGQPVFGESVTIFDDPQLVKGLVERPFDREGIVTSKLAVVKEGELKSWLLNLHAARQLGMEPTGHASGGVSAPPGVGASNFYIAPGEKSPEELMAEIQTGFYVTELLGHGINGVTGDYSLGASGFWIEQGQIAYPVSEVTIAGNLKEMYRTLVPANDLVINAPVCAPTVLIEKMMVAGL